MNSSTKTLALQDNDRRLFDLLRTFCDTASKVLDIDRREAISLLLFRLVDMLIAVSYAEEMYLNSDTAFYQALVKFAKSVEGVDKHTKAVEDMMRIFWEYRISNENQVKNSL